MTPALQLLKRWRPDLETCVIVEFHLRQLLEGNSDVDQLLAVAEGRAGTEFASRLRMIQELRRRHFSLCVNLHGGPTSTFLTRFSGAQWKVGFHHFRSQRLYDFVVPDARTILNQPTLHTAELQAAVFFWLGLPRQPIPAARLFVTTENTRLWNQKRVSLELSREGDYAIIHPTALYASKQWAPEHFAELGSFLEKEAGIVPIYSCGPHESAVLDAVARASQGPVRRLTGASLGEFAAALAGARLFVGNDSGPAHMAAALGRPSVVIFGSSSSAVWGPWPPACPTRPARVVQNYYECNPCPGDRCYRFDRPECILSVTFEQVRSAVETVLEN